MLDENKSTFQSAADAVLKEDWRNIDKNVLCNQYLDETKKNVKEALFSAILVKYWGHIQKFYYISKSIATEEDVYEWLVDSVLYALEHASWRNPESSIYNDPNGPDKVINRCLKCRRLTFYQAHNRQKRKGGFGNISLDEISDNVNENSTVFEDSSTEFYNSESVVNKLIASCFNEKKYLTAFIIDNIAYGDTFKLLEDDKDDAKEEAKEDKKADKEATKRARFEEKNPDAVYEEEEKVNKADKIYVFSSKRLVKRIKKISVKDIPYFAKRYQLPEKLVEEKVVNYCINTDDKIIKTLIEQTIDDLKLNYLRGNLDVDRFSESR